MAYTPDRYMLAKRPGFSNFGSLDSDQVARLNAVVAKAKATADEAQSLAPGFLTNAWATLIGADTTTAAARSNAASAQTLYATLAAKRDRLIADPNSSEADVEEMEGATPALQNVAVQQSMTQLGPGAFYDQVIAQTGSDVVEAVKNPFGIPLWIWGAGALAILILVKMPRRR